jgi:glycosyltransferase involved in cell wall biosynthesis
VNVHQVLSGAGPVDAVTRQALAWRERFRAWGWGGRDVAVHIDPRIDGAVAPIAALAPAASDVLLVHYSAYAPRLAAVMELPNPTLLLSHNVTPARWLWDHAPMVAVQCALGRRELARFAERADAVAGVSAYNAAELGSETVIPILFQPAERQSNPRIGGSHGRSVLFVGRLSPHKRQDELIRVLALLRRHRLPDARLALVGEPVSAGYRPALQELADRLAPGAVTIESGLGDAELAARYRGAGVFVSLSEHEGFCIPLLEAFDAGLPVIARPAGGVAEVAGDAALLVEDRDPAVLAELVALAIEDTELREELRARGRARLDAYAPERTEAAMRAALEALA